MAAPTLVVGVGAGIAAYKAAGVVRGVIPAGHDVTVIPTPTSLEFVGLATWEALSGHRVRTTVFDMGGADHVEIARDAQLIVIAPATANLIARLAQGMADDLLTTTVLAARCPVVIAPAMHSAMWDNPATQDNIATLRSRGYTIIDPVEGALSSGDSGIGRLPEAEDIVASALGVLGATETALSAPYRGSDRPRQSLEGQHILVSAGGTHEAIDPVRFLGNRSSGRQGVAIAQAARDRGAHVTLIAANVDPALIPDGVDLVTVESAAQLHDEVMTRLNAVDAVVMAAAVADFRPAHPQDAKIAKDPTNDSAPTIELVRTPDILAAVSASPDRPRVLFGFGAQTGSVEEVLAAGRAKAIRKGADLLAVNAVGAGRGFGDVDNHLYLLDSSGNSVGELTGSKVELAAGVVDRIADALGTMTQ